MPGSSAAFPRPPSKNPEATLTRQARASRPAGIAARRRRPRTAIQVISTWAAIIGAGAASRACPPQASGQVFTPERAAHTPPTRSTTSRAPIARASRRGTDSAVVVVSGVVVTVFIGVPLPEVSGSGVGERAPLGAGVAGTAEAEQQAVRRPGLTDDPGGDLGGQPVGDPRHQERDGAD